MNPPASPSGAGAPPSLWALFHKNPAGFLWRSFFKVCVGPMLYGRGERYEASRFWRDRYSKFGLSLQGSGDEGFSEGENREMYRRAAASLLELCRREDIRLPGLRVLDIGCGTGFYTELLRDQGIGSYTGVDVTDVLFEEHRKRFPGYEFLRSDATAERLAGKFDVVFMLDVIQNIVTEERFAFAMRNVKDVLADGGVFVVAPIMPESRKHLYYMRFWSREDMQRNFPGYRLGEMIPFRNDHIVAIRKE